MNGHWRTLLYGALITGFVGLLAALSVAGLSLWRDVELLRYQVLIVREDQTQLRDNLIETWKAFQEYMEDTRHGRER